MANAQIDLSKYMSNDAASTKEVTKEGKSSKNYYINFLAKIEESTVSLFGADLESTFGFLNGNNDLAQFQHTLWNCFLTKAQSLNPGETYLIDLNDVFALEIRRVGEKQAPNSELANNIAKALGLV